jgi:protein TonB
MRRLPFLTVALLACGGADAAPAVGEFTPATPVEAQEPIPYPPELFTQGVEGEVMLYLVIDSSGAVVRDSVRVATSSGYPAFDAAAMVAAPSLRFSPARRGDTAVSAPLQVPIRFLLPDSAQPPETP